MLWFGVRLAAVNVPQGGLDRPIQLRVILEIIRYIIIQRAKVLVIVRPPIHRLIVVIVSVLRHVNMQPELAALHRLVRSLSPDPNVVLRFAAQGHVVLPGAHEIHLVVVSLDVELGLVAVALVVSFVPHIVLPFFLVTVIVVVSFALLLIDDVGLVLVLHLENTQAINIEDFTNFNIHLLLCFYFLAFRLQLHILIVNNGKSRSILKAKIHQTLLLRRVCILRNQAQGTIYFEAGGRVVAKFNYLIL